MDATPSRRFSFTLAMLVQKQPWENIIVGGTDDAKATYGWPVLFAGIQTPRTRSPSQYLDPLSCLLPVCLVMTDFGTASTSASSLILSLGVF